jgi:HAD superfamily hydrolase (TIGR01509 family)
MNLRGVIFDMDGVLCDSEAFVAEAACEMFRRCHGITVRPEEFHPFIGTGEERYLQGVADLHGITLHPATDKMELYKIYLDLIPGRLNALPGSKEFAVRCKAQGLKLAVATSADRVKMEGNLREIGLPESFFDACVTGDEVIHKKPAPDVFLKAAEKLGLDPARCLVVEDATAGVQAGRAAGCRCAGITSSYSAGELARAGAEWTVGSLLELPV